MNAPAIISAQNNSALATVERHRHDLAPVDWQNNPTVIDRHTRLIPAEELGRCIAELEAALVPAAPATVARLAATLVGSYPGREVTEPEIYARALTSIFAEHSLDIGRQAIEVITRKLRFLPTRADAHEALTVLTKNREGPLRVARQMALERDARAKGAVREKSGYNSLPDDAKRAHEALMASWLKRMPAR